MRSLSLHLFGLSGLFALAVFSTSGCAPSNPAPSAKLTSGSMPPESGNLRERMEEKWLSDATRGLTFGADTVAVANKKPSDRAQAVSLARLADKSLGTENIWFKAAGMFRDAILADPTYAPAYEGLARSLLLEGNLDLVQPALVTALRLDPTMSKARFEYGMVVQMRGDFAGSVKIWKDMVARDPGYPDAYARMSIASYFAQDYPSAYAYLAEADRRKQNVPSQFRPLLKEAAPRP